MASAISRSIPPYTTGILTDKGLQRDCPLDSFRLFGSKHLWKPPTKTCKKMTWQYNNYSWLYLYIYKYIIYIYTSCLHVFPNNHLHASFPILHLAHSTFKSFQLNETTIVYLYPTRKEKKTKKMNPIDLRSLYSVYTATKHLSFFPVFFVVFPPFFPRSPRCNVSCSVGPSQWPGDEGPNRTGPWGGWAFPNRRISWMADGWRPYETPSTLAKREIWDKNKLTSFHILSYFWSFFAQASSGSGCWTNIAKMNDHTVLVRVNVSPVISWLPFSKQLLTSKSILFAHTYPL